MRERRNEEAGEEESFRDSGRRMMRKRRERRTEEEGKFSLVRCVWSFEIEVDEGFPCYALIRGRRDPFPFQSINHSLGHPT